MIADTLQIAGVRFRAFEEADYDAAADILNRDFEADGVDWRLTAAEFRSEWEHTPDFDPRRDVIMAEVDGRPVAFGELAWRVRDGAATFHSSGAVLPEARRRGIGRAILRENERRSRLRAPIEATGLPHVHQTWAPDRQVGAHALFRAEGYEPVRFFFEMVRANLDDLPAAPLPAGLEIRPVRREQLRQIFDADAEAFMDHWGAHERTDEDFDALLAQPDLDETLWRVAWDGNEVAGVIVNTIWRKENEQLGVRRGCLDRVSVRRPWRRRGLARALIVESLRAIRAAGMDSAFLGVDADNPLGALGLYEGTGFTIDKRATALQKSF